MITWIRNLWRAAMARHSGWDSFIAVDGSVRWARNVAHGEHVTIPLQHFRAVEDRQRRNLEDRRHH